MSTRTRILSYLEKHPSATAAELARSLGLTGANIRHHLGRMLEAGQVVELDRRQEGLGRPAVVYGASAKVLDTGVQDLLEAALVSWLESAPEETQVTLLHQLALTLAGGPSAAAAGASQRLTQAVERLNSLHYQARWEAGARGPRIILGRCPYASILDRHPGLCRMDGYLLESCTGMKTRQSARLERGKDGAARCIFQVS